MKLTSNKWFALITGLAPLILANVKGGDKIAPVIPTIVEAIKEAEQIKGAAGPEKKTHVLNAGDAAVAAINATGKLTLNPAEVRQTVSDGVDAVIGAVHVVEGAKVVKAPGTSPA